MSAGLKRVIGRDLITDDEVAIFELVKNSFDAGAKMVQLRFEQNSIWLVDNGEGMTYNDITDKWLFVAYSAKRESRKKGFRESISERRHYAGSKGIGRFSSDRLGRTLVLQTRPKSEPTGTVHELTVDWEAFEIDPKESFPDVRVGYRELAAFNLPKGLRKLRHGTALTIADARVIWDRARLLHLKASLAKLINPFGAGSDGFKIEIIAPEEQKADRLASQATSATAETVPNAVVNGEIGNFIFSTLREKTTFIAVTLTDDGQFLNTTLTDRGEDVFRVREANPYPRLRTSGFQCQLFYLNQSAKTTFARRMGIPSVRFGSVFLFRNGFRVYPIGEAGDDWFGIDARKQQGYARFLGTRDIIGRIDVSGTEEEFKEASSRNQGLVQTEATIELGTCFWEHCLKRLERYVVPVSWADKGERLADDLSGLMTDSGRARVAAAVARLIDTPEVELLHYSRKLIGVLNERSSQFEGSIASLRSIAAKTGDPKLLRSLEQAEQRFEELKAAEAEAQRIASEERKAKDAATERAEKAEAEAKAASTKLEEEKKRTLFLTSIGSLDTQNIINMHHQITIYAADIKQQIENCIAAAKNKSISPSDLISRLEQVAFVNQKVLSIARLATKANFRLESDNISEDIASYIEQYIDEGARPFLGLGPHLEVDNDGSGLVRTFRPMEVAIVVDNLIDNARKAKATKVSFRLFRPDKTTLTMEVTDDGRGFPADLEPEDIFGLGISRTSGSGLGLYHVRQILGEMGGTISVVPSDIGATFLVRFSS